MARIKLVLTGGGCDLPMIRGLTDKAWLFREQTVRLSRASKLPDLILERYGEDFAREYPQLAVALGGALPMVLDEGGTQKLWHGGERPPGPLTRYQITGV